MRLFLSEDIRAVVVPGILEVNGAKVAPTSEDVRKAMLEEIRSLAPAIASDIEAKKAARDMLRHGRYKPSGRGKPASEYLAEAAAEGEFPFINNFVDGLNLVSFKYHLPISLIDPDKAGTPEFILRRGRAGESYVFNPSGQELSLEDLLCVASLETGEPFATPVKDCQKTKSGDESVSLAAVIYSPARSPEKLEAAVAELEKIYTPIAGKVARVFPEAMLPKVT